jgi:hypothetical protein
MGRDDLFDKVNDTGTTEPALISPSDCREGSITSKSPGVVDERSSDSLHAKAARAKAATETIEEQAIPNRTSRRMVVCAPRPLAW